MELKNLATTFGSLQQFPTVGAMTENGYVEYWITATDFIFFSASENLLSLRSLRVRVKWASRSGLKDMRDRFWRRKSKKRKHFEDLRSGSVIMCRRVAGLRLARKVVVVLTGLGAEVFRVLEMISEIAWLGLEQTVGG